MKTNPLAEAMQQHLARYFDDLGNDTQPTGLHDMVVRSVERPLLEMVMQRAQGNQSRAALWLGLNRNTLRKKLSEHDLLDE